MPYKFNESVRASVIIEYEKYSNQKKKYALIKSALASQNIQISEKTISRYVKTWLKEKTTSPKMPNNIHKRKITDDQLIHLNRLLLENDELTAEQLKLRIKFEGSTSSIYRYVHRLGWTNKRTEYCQVVSEQNQLKRYYFSCAALVSQEKFEDVIFIDETTVELRNTSYRHWYKKRQIEVYRGKKGKFKHNVKLHIWAGISAKGRTSLIMFTGKMNSKGFQNIMKIGFLPFVRKNYPYGYRLYMDNDPKHKSHSTIRFYKRHGVELVHSPAQSPDFNPIEMTWNDLKSFLCNVYKPKNKQQLINGIKTFWKSVSAEACRKKISHLDRVFRKCIELNGQATGL